MPDQISDVFAVRVWQKSPISWSRTSAIREFSGDTKFVPGTLDEAFVQIRIKSRSLEVTDDISDKDRREIKQTTYEEVLEADHAPSTALTLMRARAQGVRNFSVFSNHITIIPAIRAILYSPDMRIDPAPARSPGPRPLFKI